MIELVDVNKTYNNGKVKTEALKNINLSLPEHGMFFLCGKSGSGKSTLLNIIGTMDRPSSGDVIFNGKSLSEHSKENLTSFRNSNISYVFQNNNLIDCLNVYENVSLALELNGKKDEQKVLSVLKSVDLSGLEKRKINELSGGQQQRVAIARALIKESALIICDEPTGALDSENSENIFSLLKEISKKSLVVIASHDLESAEKYGDAIIKIKDGKIASDTTFYNSEKKELVIHKTKLNLGTKLKLFFRSVFRRPFRFISMFIALTISLGVVGILTNFTSLNENEMIKNSMLQNDEKYISFGKYMYKDGVRCSEKISENEKNRIEQDYKSNVKPLFDGYNSEYSNRGESDDMKYRPYSADGYLEFSSDELTSYGLSLLSGTLPSEYDEMCITDYQYNLFCECGYKKANVITKINSYSDIIGKEFSFNEKRFGGPSSFKVTGIIDTKFDFARYQDIKLNDDMEAEYTAYIHNGIHNSFFMKTGFYDKYQKNALNKTIGYTDGRSNITNIYCVNDSEKSLASSSLSLVDDNVYYFDNYNNSVDNVFVTYSYLFKKTLSDELEFYLYDYAEKIYTENSDKFIENTDNIFDYYGYYSYLKSHDYSDNKYVKITKKQLSGQLIEEKRKEILDSSKSYDVTKMQVKVFAASDKTMEFDDIHIGGVIIDEENTLCANENLMNKIVESMGYRANQFCKIILPIDKNTKNDIFKLNKEVNENVNDNYCAYDNYKTVYSQYHMSNEYSYAYSAIKASVESLWNISKYLMMVFVPLTLLLIVYYFSGIVIDDERKIGILKACGCSGKDVNLIYITGGTALGVMFSFAVSIALIIVISKIDMIIFHTGHSYVSAAFINPLTFVTVLGTSVVFIALGMLLPLNKIIRRNPIESINKL